MNSRTLVIGLAAAFLVSAAAARAAEEPLAEAEKLLLGGKYGEAAEILAPLAEKKDPAAVLALARCQASEGKYTEAVKTLSEAAEDQAALQAELARLAFDRGDYKEAQTRADEAIRLEKDQLQALWIQGELYRVAGKLDEAERGYRRLVNYYNVHDVEQAESLHWIGLAAARYARWNRLSGQFSFLVNELYPDALKLQANYWPARYESGRLFLEKFNKADAEEDLKSALELNPNAAEVHVALAELAVAKRDMEKAEASVARALEINPRLLAAHLAKADLAWANFKPREAERLLLEDALPLNPKSEATLGRLAACYLMLDDRPQPGEVSRFAKLHQEVATRNPCAGEFYFTLATLLEDRHQHARARQFLLKAIEVMPQLVGPRSHLGLLHMRSGREDEAAKVLDEAFEADPFNLRVHNMQRVLGVLDGMKTLETEHVVIKYHGEHDELLAKCMAEHLDAVYSKWCREFGYRPPGKPLVEVFNRTEGIDGQEWFSTRMTGLPYLGAVAASTGYMLAMSSPNDPLGGRQFNWAQVLRHEFVHVITLQQTKFNIPHWFTEGLAVYYEDIPRPQEWTELLLRRVPEGDLFDLQTLNFGFTRPHTSEDWQLAYCQAELYVEYILARHGSGWLRKLLAAYIDGQTTAEAIPHVLGVTQEAFEKGYVEYVEGVITGMSMLEHPSESSFAELLEAHGEKPDDAGVAAELAHAYLGRDADKEALELAEKTLEDHPGHQLATYVLARLHLQDEKTAEAVALLEGCLDRDAPQPNVLNLLAGLKLKAEEYDDAAELYALGERLDSVNLKWTKALARVYLVSENDEKLAEALAKLARADSDDLSARKKLAQLALDRRDYAAAEGWADEALQIDVIDVDVRRLLAEAAVGQRDYPEAIKQYELAVELADEEFQPALLYGLADACIQAERSDEARKALKKLLKMESDYPGAKLMLEGLKETDTP